MDRFWANFDKFMLALFVIYFTLLGALAVYFMFHHATPSGELPDVLQSFMAAMLDDSKFVLGALVGLITGRAIQRAQDKANGPMVAPPSDQPAGAAK